MKPRPRHLVAVALPIAIGLVLLGFRDDPAAPGSTHRRLLVESPERYSVSMPGPAAPETIILRNAGDEIVSDPRLIVNGRGDWFDLDSMLEEILEPGLSDRDKAFAIWEFLVASRRHDDPTHNQAEMHDPVRLLNVYGYGFCDDAANSFMTLARQAGLEARIWHLGGHVVSEAWYDDDWHMFDADGEVVYLGGDEETIASVNRLAGNPRLIRRKPSPNPLYWDTEHLVDLYTSRGDNRVARWYSGRSRHAMSFDLRPGESILRSRSNWGLYVDSRYQTEPQVYGNGRFTFEPVLRDDVFHQGAVEVTGVNLESEQGEPRLVFAPDIDEEARLTYHFISPYPLLAGRVRIVGEPRGAGALALELARDGERWHRAWSSEGTGGVDALISLDRFLPRKANRPTYHHQLRLTYAAHAEGARWHVANLRYEHDFQVAPQSLPSFDEGPNEVLYVDASEGERKIELVFEYGE